MRRDGGMRWRKECGRKEVVDWTWMRKVDGGRRTKVEKEGIGKKKKGEIRWMKVEEGE